MATYLMLGKMSLDSLTEMSAARTEKATALIEENGGEVKSAYALLGDSDFALIVELPDYEQAMKTSIGLSRLLGISFTTMPAVSIDRFDKVIIR